MLLNRLNKDIIGQRVTRERPIVVDAAGGELTFAN
jgi:hypothetical protein